MNEFFNYTGNEMVFSVAEMLMEKIFWKDPYATMLQTKIAAVNGATVLPESTIIFSFCGGQESDKAQINEMVILNSRIEGKNIWYTLPGDHNLIKGSDIVMTIDWTRRYRLMRLHFAAELVLELMTKKGSFEKIGAHIAEHKARIDFKADISLTPLLPEITKQFNAIVDHDLSIIKGFSDEVTERRFWKIDGFAQVPCGGTHVRSTGEVGHVILKRDKPGKGIERIEIRLEKE